MSSSMSDNSYSIMNMEHYKIDPEHKAATGSPDTSGDDRASKLLFECQYCGKSYSSKKKLHVGDDFVSSLYFTDPFERHARDTGTATACAKQRLFQKEFPPKPRWACSRCGKDCTTTSSVEVTYETKLRNILLTLGLAPHQQIVLEVLRWMCRRWSVSLRQHDKDWSVPYLRSLGTTMHKAHRTHCWLQTCAIHRSARICPEQNTRRC